MLRISKMRAAAFACGLSCMLVPNSNVAGAWQKEQGRPASFDGTLSVLTYNVKGLPWPLASERPQAFATMATRLRAMRADGRNPHIVVLQEAFTEEAQGIGRQAGYRYAAYGPDASQAGLAPMTAGDRRHRAGASWIKGEAGPKLLGSGLQILSDYPILSVRSMAFPGFACAGFDCLSNKGAVMVTVNVPGVPTPVEIITTHLNCRRKSGVSDDRSFYAYRRQAAFLSRFIAENHNADHPLIVAGDFNVGKDIGRRDYLFRELRSGWGGNLPVADALRQVAARAPSLPADALFSMRKAKDWQFYVSGRKGALIAQAIEVPFGTEKDGGMLSDHVGYTSIFRLERK